MIRKMVFIEPKSPDLHIFSRFPMPRLGPVLLATILKERGIETRVYAEQVAPIDWADVLGADVVGVSTITSTAPRAYEIARRVRAAGIPVVLGGPHPTAMPEEAAEHGTFVLRGEAEESLPALLAHIDGAVQREDVPGLAWLDREGLRMNRVAGPVDIARNPAPDLDLIAGFAGTTGFLGRTLVPVQVSRGCPFDCTFCSVTSMFGRKMRYRTVAAVLAELERYDSSRHHIFFYDDNFAGDPRRAKDLLRAMKDRRFRFTWSSQVRVDAARDPELLDLMRDTRCDTVYIGFESVSPESLVESNKRQTVADSERAIAEFRRRRIGVHGMFVFGFDSDTKETPRATVRFARRNGLTSIQFLLLTPLPGARLFGELDSAGRILFRDWSLYDTHHVVIRHPAFTPKQMQRAQTWAHRAFYLPSRAAGLALRLRWAESALCLYASALNRQWRRRNKIFLKALELLDPSEELAVSVELRKPCVI